MEPEGSLPQSQTPATCSLPELDQSVHQRISPSTRPCEILRNIVSSYGEGLLAFRLTPKLKDNPLSGVRDFLFNIFAVTLQLEAVPSSTTWERAFLWWLGPSYYGWYPYKMRKFLITITKLG